MSNRLTPLEVGFALLIIFGALMGGLLIGSGVAQEERHDAPLAQDVMERGPRGTNLGGDSGAPVAAARADLASRLGVDAMTIIDVSAGAVEWSDGSVGCPQPGRMYPQVITPGYRIILSVGGVQYEYHASRAGTPFLCAEPTPPVG